jgi:PAS domain S-box-containing protein
MPGTGVAGGAGGKPGSLAFSSERREALTERWRAVISRTGFVPTSPAHLRRRIGELTEQILTILEAESIDRAAARGVGMRLAQLGNLRDDALGGTLEILSGELLAGLPSASAARLSPRVAALLGEIAAGFAAHQRSDILDAQEALRRALLDARDQAERALRESEARFRAIFEGAAIAIAVTGLDGALIDVNPALPRMLGYTGEEMRGRPFAQFLHPDDLTAGMQHFQALATGTGDASTGAAGDVGHQADLRFRGRDGRVVRARLTLSLVRDAEGRPQFAIGMGEDVTAQTEAEEARRGAEAEAAALRELDRLKDELLSTISHELRTPLTVMHGYAQRLAARSGSLPQEVIASSAAAILAGSEQLSRLVEDLLDYARMQRGEVQVRTEDVDLAMVLEAVFDELQRRPEGERMISEVSAPLPAHCDPMRVRQVVMNLVENAVKYAPTGPIVVRAEKDGAEPVIHVRVTDQGPGIPQREQARVWDKFYRGSQVAGLNAVRGSGIGLSVVKALVEAQRGRVGLDSTVGKGSSFWFEVPAASTPPDSA